MILPSTLVVLQNAWMPTKRKARWLEDLHKKNAEFAHRVWIGLMLGTKTGKHLQEIFGSLDSCCEADSNIYFCNTTLKVAVGSSGIMPPDMDYLRSQIKAFLPERILACGNQAHLACGALLMDNILGDPSIKEIPLLYMTHPTARHLTKDSPIFPEVLRVLQRSNWTRWEVYQSPDGVVTSKKLS